MMSKGQGRTALLRKDEELAEAGMHGGSAKDGGGKGPGTASAAPSGLESRVQSASCCDSSPNTPSEVAAF